MTQNPHPRDVTQVAVPEALLADVATNAARIDSGQLSTRTALADIAAAGLADIGTASGPGGLDAQAAVIQTLAQKSLSTAFSLWCHRMTVEYLSIVGGASAQMLLPKFRAGEQIGSSAMADAFRYAAGRGDLSLTVHRDTSGQLRLSGRLAWASNLFHDAVVFAAAHGPDSTAVIVAFDVAAPGVTIGPELDLLALRGTASTSITLDNVLLTDKQVLTTDVVAFAQQARPVLSLLQASFCLGLASESYAQTQLSGDHEVFAADHTQLGARLNRAKQQLTQYASTIGTDNAPSAREVLAFRLEAGVLVKDITRLETLAAGSRAFMTTSDVNRRYREATFIPLQAPSEAQLRSELAAQPRA